MADPAAQSTRLVDIASLRGRWLAWRGVRRARELEELRSLTPALLAEALRRSLILISVLCGLFSGVAMALAPAPEGPSFRLFEGIPGWPVTWGALLIVGALVTAAGFRRDRQRTLYVGLWVCASWYALSGFGFGINWMMWAWNGLGGHAPALYPLGVYGLIAAVHAVSAEAVRAFRRRAWLLADEERRASA